MSPPVEVLLVDDHQMFAEALELLLGATPDLRMVGTVSSGEEALNRCDRACPDVVLMDIELPGMDGIEATRRLRRTCPDTQVVVITAYQQAHVIARAIEAGACGFVPKTQTADDLVEVIRRAAHGEMVLPARDLGPIFEALRRSAGSAGPAGPASAVAERLSPREYEILRALARGLSTAEVARTLFISPQTVQSHVKRVLAKLGARSKLEAVVVALREGLIQPVTQR